MRLGAFVDPPAPWPRPADADPSGPRSLYDLALRWLAEDREHRRALEHAGRKKRGARRDEVPTDSETFYKK